jgi:glutathione S-transferase
MTSTPEITLYGGPLSGHAHRVVLLLRMLDLPYKSLDTLGPARQTPDFLAMNPMGQIPVLTDGDVLLSDSNAILVYLAKRYDPAHRWLPEEPLAAAQTQRWLSIAAGEVKFGLALARASAQWGLAADRTLAIATAERLLRFMDKHLATQDFLTGPSPTIGDLACYSYVAHGPEGGVPLDPYPKVRAWLDRVEALPGFTPMPRSSIPQPAVK